MSFHITKIVQVPDDSDTNVEDRYQATCIREDCPWTSEPHVTRLGAEEAAHSHESNGDRFTTGEHPVIPEENQP